MDDRTQRVADEIASIEAISHNTVKALSTVTTPLNVIIEMYIAGLEAKLQALRALVKQQKLLKGSNHSSLTHHVYETIKRRQEGRNAARCSQQGI